VDSPKREVVGGTVYTKTILRILTPLSEIDDYTQEWTFKDNSLDFVHLRWLVGTISDWAELFRQAYRVLKPGGFIETFECNGFYESDDGTLTDDTALSKWGYFFREGALALGSKASFSVVKDRLQVKGLEEANFVRITEHHIKVIWPTRFDPRDRS
jgi:SAM-dependent methyltransferase